MEFMEKLQKQKDDAKAAYIKARDDWAAFAPPFVAWCLIVLYALLGVVYEAVNHFFSFLIILSLQYFLKVFQILQKNAIHCASNSF